MKLLLVIGTRPEAIKMAPLLRRLMVQDKIEFKICSTGQHKDLLDSILDFFNLSIDYDLALMSSNQGLHGLTSSIITKTKPIFEDYKPDYVLVHGDTTTSFASALAAFYSGIKVAHVEAGLRTHNKNAPFPEELNRAMTARIADIHFSPTKASKNNLEAEGVLENVFITGNTVIDALHDALEIIDENDTEILFLKNNIDFEKKKIILFTGHRRENFGGGFESIFSSLSKLMKERNDITIVYPVHPNPNVKLMAEKYFNNNENIKLISPLSYGPFIWLLKKSHIILTDSGGIQEEAPSLGKPVLVLREATERPEAVEAGTVILVGTNKEKIFNWVNSLLNNPELYEKMSGLINPYGDGKASDRIINYFNDLNLKNE
jgi:UDP-N-acetylglucosamine 2-epimerase (non-hydrolysing)